LLLGVVGLFAMVMSKPIIPFIVAKMTGKKVIITLDRNSDMKVKKANIKDDTYYFKKNPMYMIKEYKGNYVLGGVKTDIIHLDEKIVSTHEFQNALYELQEKYDITTYDDLRRALEEGRIQEEYLEVPLFFKMSLDEVSNYACAVPPDGIQGEIDDLSASRNNSTLNDTLKLLPFIVIICICIIVGAVAIKILT
jgi:hypothetical protein